MPLEVRRAERADATDLVDLLVEMHEECALHRLSVPKMLATLAEAIDSGRVIGAWRDGELVGSIALQVVSAWYSDERHLVDRWLYVRPPARRSSAARRLLKAAAAVAARECLPVYFAIASADDFDRKVEFFKRSGLGLRQVGAVFLLPR